MPVMVVASIAVAADMVSIAEAVISREQQDAACSFADTGVAVERAFVDSSVVAVVETLVQTVADVDSAVS